MSVHMVVANNTNDGFQISADWVQRLLVGWLSMRL